MLRTIIKLILVLLCIAIIIKCTTGKGATDARISWQVKIENEMQANMVADTDSLICPMCGIKYENNNEPFCSKECLDRYGKRIESFSRISSKIDNITDKGANISKDIGNAFLDNL